MWLALLAGCWMLAVGCQFSPDLSRFEPCAADGSCALGATCLLPERRCLPDCLDCPPGEDAGEDAGDSGVEFDAGQDGGEDAGTVHPKLRVAGPGELATAANNAAYNEGISATGGIAPYQFRVVEGTLPGSIQLELDGGVNGVPGGAADVTFTVEVSDSATPPQVAQRALNFLSASAPLGLKIMTRGFPDARVGWPYSYRLQAMSGTPPYTWSFPSGSFPAGVTLNQDTGEVSGTPTVPGAATVNIKVVDSLLGSDGPMQFRIEVLP